MNECVKKQLKELLKTRNLKLNAKPKDAENYSISSEHLTSQRIAEIEIGVKFVRKKLEKLNKV